jgi:hypothetical protein
MDPRDRLLIRELLGIALDSPSGVNAKEFRARHEDHLDALNRLEQGPYVEKKDNLYRVKLLALAELKGDDARIETLVHQCAQVFCLLRDRYKHSTDAPVALAEMVEKTHIPESQLRLVLTYLVDAPIWGGYTSDLLGSEEVSVTPGESILRYKTFDDVIQQLRDWASRPLHGGSSTPGDQPPRPLFLRDMNGAHLLKPSDLPQWYASLPTKIHEMLLEVRYAVQKELSALPSMGLRSVIDMVCNDQVGDVGSFAEKLHKLEEKRLITPKKRKIIETLLEVGHASIHRGHFPTGKDLQVVIDIVDHLLEELYVLDKTSELLRASVPKRQLKK